MGSMLLIAQALTAERMRRPSSWLRIAPLKETNAHNSIWKIIWIPAWRSQCVMSSCHTYGVAHALVHLSF